MDKSRCGVIIDTVENFLVTAANPVNTFSLLLSTEGDDTTRYLNNLLSNPNNITKSDFQIVKNLLGNHSYRIKLIKKASAGSIFRCGYFSCVACRHRVKRASYKGFQQIRLLAEKKLKEIAYKWEASVYLKGKLGQKLGNIGRKTGLWTAKGFANTIPLYHLHSRSRMHAVTTTAAH